MIGRELLEWVVTAKRDARVYACEQDFALFAMYYFAEHFTYAIPGFQWTMYLLLNEFTRGKFKFLLWVMFRESAKTTVAKIYVVYCIAYRKKRFINWDSYDKSNSESALFDISTWLQTNRRLVADFGQLFYEDPKATARYSRMKRMGEFITTNGVKVKAYTTQEGTRGRIFDRFRPDLYVVEDYETTKTIESAPVTAKIIKHIDELKAGLAVDGQVIFLGNYISEVGSVAQMIAEAAANPVAWRMQMVAVEKDGEIAWPDKYVRTNEEAVAINAGRERKEWVVSLMQLKKDLNASGRKVYEAEMMNNPEAAGEPFFDRERIDKDIAKAKIKPALRAVGGLSIFEEYVAKYRYAFGGDTAKGVGRDSCADVGIRFSPGAGVPAKVIGTYASSTISPDMFAYEMRAHGNLFGECLLAPELNNCFDKETEVLTNDGWKKFEDLKQEDFVATLNIARDAIEFQKPTSRTKRYFKEMYVGRQGHADFCISEGHNILSYRRNLKDMVLAPVESFLQSNMILKHSASWNRIENPKKVGMDAWLAFLGIFIADGHRVRRHGIKGKRQYYHLTIAQSESYPEKIKAIRAILGKIPFHFFETKQKQVVNGKRYNDLVIFHITSKELWESLEKIGTGENKKAPAYVLGLSSRQIQIFLDNFFMGDGHARRGNERVYFPGLSKPLADQLQEMLLKVGKIATVKERVFKEKKNYEVYEYKSGDTRTWMSGKDLKKVKYDDYAHCVSVPNKTLLVRRNGRPIFLGNTGYATVTQLKVLKYPRIYQQVKTDTVDQRVTKDLGWEATSANVAAIYFAFRTAYNDGELEVPSLALLMEMRAFTKRDLDSASRRSEVEGITRHFDLLRAACIAWEMRAVAVVTKPKPYKQSAAEHVSEYHG